VQFFVKIFGSLQLLPITENQIKMLKENNLCDSSDIFLEYDIKPQPFSQDNIKYLL
jgi:hypothetical protein